MDEAERARLVSAAFNDMYIALGQLAAFWAKTDRAARELLEALGGDMRVQIIANQMHFNQVAKACRELIAGMKIPNRWRTSSSGHSDSPSRLDVNEAVTYTATGTCRATLAMASWRSRHRPRPT